MSQEVKEMCIHLHTICTSATICVLMGYGVSADVQIYFVKQ